MTIASEHDAEEAIELLRLPTPYHTESDPSNQPVNDTLVTKSQALNLYISHLLSMWNARTYEFAAIIFTASAFPETLTASALRGIITTIASICFSASIGRWIDHAPNRLKTLLSTITVNRLSVLSACLFWVFLVGEGSGNLHERLLDSSSSILSATTSVSENLKDGLFAFVLFFGVLEKLSGSANMMSMERDWVVTIAAPEGLAYDLTHLNAVMRRIDLVCKLVAPILLSVLTSASGSVKIGVLTVGSMSAVSWPVEWWCAKKVWSNNSKLQRPKIVQDIVSDANTVGSPDGFSALVRVRSCRNGLVSKCMQWFLQCTKDLRQYFSSQVWIPSFALSLLHLSALSYSATFITYLLNVGFSLNLITIARAIGSVVEISSTIVTPFGVSYLGKAHHHNHHPSEYEDEESEITLLEEAPEQHGSTETGLERLGLWGITWQLLNLVPVVLTLWALSPSTTPTPTTLLSFISPKATQNPGPSPYPTTTISDSTSTPQSPSPTPPPSLLLLALPLFTFLSASRLGLWIYDLTTQQLTQTLVSPPASRSSFAGVENAMSSLFELGQHVATAAVWSRPEQFRFVAVGSWAAVAVSVCLYAGWVRRQRGHLLHWRVLGEGCGGGGGGGSGGGGTKTRRTRW